MHHPVLRPFRVVAAVIAGAGSAWAMDGARTEPDPQATFHALYVAEPPSPTEMGRALRSPLLGVAESGSNWWTGFAAPPAGLGMGSSVNAMTVFAGQLIVAGDFLSAGGIAANRIAAWDGASWSALGNGLNGRVFALAVSGGNLVVGGTFSLAGGVPAKNVAVWNGSSWSALGAGPGGAVYALADYNGQVVAGGGFTGYVKRWDGVAWSLLGTGRNSAVVTLSVYSSSGVSYLVAGGLFTDRSTQAPYETHIAKWNGTAWSALSDATNARGGTASFVASTYVRNDSLWVGGTFRSVNGGVVPVNRVALWVPNGALGAWTTLGAGTSSNVLALSGFGGSIAVGGEFNVVDGILAANHIAAWNGSVWAPFGLGTAGTVYRPLVRALQEYNGELYAGGWFNGAGGNPSAFIARWQGPPPGPGAEGLAVLDPRVAPGDLRLHPNPTRGPAELDFSLDRPGRVEVSVYDVRGRAISTILDLELPVGRHTAVWSGRDSADRPLPSGVYFVRLQGPGEVRTESVTLAR
jgi:hypothetical protein